MSVEQDIRQAAEWFRDADALVLCAGAGMGVDSGLPDFRGNEGFWRAYPPMKELGLSFSQMANPRWFVQDPTLAWGFYGHRTALYRRTPPHEGFQVLRRFAEQAPKGAFVFTSNVDGAFQKAGFDEDSICEPHGSLAVHQCLRDCGAGIFPASDWQPAVDPKTFRASEPLPRCPECGSLARPNVLMFGDGEWDSARTDAQERRFDEFVGALQRERARLVVVECGAGTAVSTVRSMSESLARGGARLVRINVREPQVPPGNLGLSLGALEALTRIEAALRGT